MGNIINHPDHYMANDYECIDVMLATQGKEAVMGFCRCNAFKYIYRAPFKDGMDDIKKAKWYLDKMIELDEEG